MTFLDFDLLEDYLISIIDLGFKFENSGPYFFDKKLYLFKSDQIGFDFSNYTKISKETSILLHKVEYELFLASKRIINDIEFFRYKTFIGGTSYSSNKIEHQSGFIKNDTSYIGYHSQRGY